MAGGSGVFGGPGRRLPRVLRDGPAPVPTASARISSLTEQSFETLLTLKEVAEVVDAEALIRATVRDLRREAESVFAAQITPMDSSYSGKFVAEGGRRTIRLTVTDFDTPAAASEPTIGDASVELEVNANGVGSIVLFLRGDKLGALQTSKPDDEDALVNIDELGHLARLVASRLR